jgi:hypothetical protein
MIRRTPQGLPGFFYECTDLEMDVKTNFEPAFFFIEMAPNGTMIGEICNDLCFSKRTDGIFHYTTTDVILNSHIIKLVISEKRKHFFYPNPHILKELFVQ